jgi:hypothetical protein
MEFLIEILSWCSIILRLVICLVFGIGHFAIGHALLLLSHGGSMEKLQQMGQMFFPGALFGIALLVFPKTDLFVGAPTVLLRGLD